MEQTYKKGDSCRKAVLSDLHWSYNIFKSRLSIRLWTSYKQGKNENVSYKIVVVV